MVCAVCTGQREEDPVLYTAEEYIYYQLVLVVVSRSSIVLTVGL